ncbi:HAD-IIA family hydrolase [soil metagenome]
MASSDTTHPSGTASQEPWVVDLDGVVWLGPEPIPGAADAVRRLRDAGHPVVFVTNSSARTVGQVEALLAAQGIEADGAVVTSAGAVAGLLAAGERVLICGGPGLEEAVTARGAVPVANDGTDPGPVDAVVCGHWPTIDHPRLRWASTAVHRGARLLASNDDATYPTPDGIVPGSGATLAAVERATGAQAVVAGKPHAPMAEVLRDRLGATGVVVGDRPDTDGLLARALGWRFVLVLSGVSRGGGEAAALADAVEPDLAAAVARRLGGQGWV